MSDMEKSQRPKKERDRVTVARQASEREPLTEVKRKRPWAYALGALAAGVLALGVTFGTNMLPLLNDGDDVSPQQKQQMEVDYFSALERGESFIQPVNFLDPAERERAKEGLGLEEEKAEALMRQAEGGLVSLGWITLWDNYAEDGDVVEVSANGLTRTVPILHAPVTIVVPYSVTAAQITLTGVRDGGGGITVAAKTSGGDAPLPPLRVGESRSLRLK